jgi:N-acetyl-anhydromuramyl-L-alanine amidase AmpD
MFETDNWPLIPARDFTRIVGKRPVKWIVIHDMEAPEKGDTAESIGRYFQHPDKPSSAHIGVDSTSIVQYVKDNDIAFGAPGANSNGIHIELAGYARQTKNDWMDQFGLSMLERAADAVAQYCHKYFIPASHITNVELANDFPGIVGHNQVSEVFKKSDHTDPGPNFPWDHFMYRVASYHFRYAVLIND